MGLKFYGIGAAECPDNIEETISINGMNIDKLRGIRDEHDEDSMFRKIGAIKYAKKIFSQQDCENPKQLRCWQHAQVPFLYAEAELANDEDHPDAKAAAALLKFSQRPDIPLEIGLSVDGGILERRTKDGQITEDKAVGKQLAQTVATDLAVTVKPCNQKCKIWLENDLTKSDLTMPPPAIYFEALKKSQAKISFNEVNDNSFKIYMKLEKLKKSLADYLGGFTAMKCPKCSQSIRFFKSSNQLPNRCSHCGDSFSLEKIWDALNK